MIHFVGAGSGAADLITLRGKNFLEQADVIIYAGSLVNPALLDYKKEGCIVYDSAKMTLEEVIEAMEKAEEKGFMTVRLHTGDPSIYGAIREQMDELDKLGIGYDYTPGVSSFCGAASALNLEYTLPGVSQRVLLTRMPGRTPVPDKEPTTIFFLSAGDIKSLVDKLLKDGRDKDTPCAIVYKATWPDEKKFVTTLDKLAQVAEENGITKTALIIVGDVVAPRQYDKSKLYDASFTTGFREGTDIDE